MGVFLFEARIKADAFHQLGYFTIKLRSFEALVALFDGLGKGRVDGHPRVERCVGVLKDHLEVEPAFPDLVTR